MDDLSVAPAGETAGVRILAIAGGSCSGKTTLADLVHAALGPDKSLIIRTDNYYRADLIQSAPEGQANFDHPSAIDFARLEENLQNLRRGTPAEGPLWDFVTHSRKRETVRYEARSVVIVEGIFALWSPEINALYDHSCYLECPEALRLERRIDRDTVERGRTEQSVREQFASQVASMHDAFVEPSKHRAHRIIAQREYCDDVQGVVRQILEQL